VVIETSAATTAVASDAGWIYSLTTNGRRLTKEVAQCPPGSA
jgi:hypothetical protein